MSDVAWLDFNSAAPQGLAQSQAAPSPPWERQESYDRDEVRASLIGQLESVLGYLYPHGFTEPKGRTFYIGNVNGDPGESLNVVLRGERAGLWHDFATGDGGDIFDLWQAARGLPSFRETIKDAALYSGAASTTPRRMPKRRQPSGGDAWGVPAATYRYTDANGSVIAEVDRFEWEKDGKREKAFRPWDVTTRRHRAPETRPLYNLPNITSAPEIVIVEGEKAANALIAQNIDATTAMGGASAPIEKTDWSVMRGRMVVIWPDNDDAGRAYADRLKDYLETEAGAASVTILNVPASRPEKWDAADAEDEDLGALIRAMRAGDERSAIKAVKFRPWTRIDLSQIPRTQFVYSDFYARGYTSLTVAAPKVGKSMLALAEAVDMATGRGIISGKEADKLRVVYYNAEDDQGVLDGRIAALLEHYDIDQSEIEGWLFPQSGIEWEGFHLSGGDDGEINETLFSAIEAFLVENEIDVLILDPLQDLTDAPETNDVFRRLGRRLRRMASQTRISIGIVHHTRKMAPGVQTQSIDDARGGGALRGTSRFNRILVPMTEDEGAKAGVDNHRWFLRIGDMESNLAPPSADVNRWFEKVSIQTPNGEHIGAIRPWGWPDAFDGVTRADAVRVQRAIASRHDEPPRADMRSNDWAGLIVASQLGMDASSKADRSRINSMISAWVESEVLTISTTRDKRAGRDVRVIRPGTNQLSED